LAYRGDKIALHGFLPPWFAGLLPEGALRELVATEMGPGNHDSFDVIARLGTDLPGAVLAVPEHSEIADAAGPIRWDRVAGFRAPVPEGVVKFSLAGVQLKFAATCLDERVTLPARAGEGNYILKLASDRFPNLPEVEFSGMALARNLDLDVAECRLVRISSVQDVPSELLKGTHALAVRRFDRNPPGGRTHIEDAGQVLGVWGERKYTQANTETVIMMLARFSTDWRQDVLEGIRRVVVDVLLGNGDNHLKNWSFIFPAGREIRLSPAYDIVPTVLYLPNDSLALKFAGTARFERVRLHKFRRLAKHLGLEADWIEREVREVVQKALDLWPKLMKDLPLTDGQREFLLDRWNSLDLVTEVRTGILMPPEGTR
jgi:serine/threonine-protein kinase HipA